MGLFRRRRRTEVVVATGPAPGMALVPRAERAIMALAAHTEQLTARVAHVERALADARDDAVVYPSHEDVLEVQIHSARVAAEVSRLAVELRAEIDRLARAQRDTSDDVARQRRIDAVAEQIVDLSDSMDTDGLDLRRTGTDDWATTR